MQRRKSIHATSPYPLRGRVLMMMSPAPADKGAIAAGAAPEKWFDLMYGLPSNGIYLSCAGAECRLMAQSVSLARSVWRDGNRRIADAQG